MEVVHLLSFLDCGPILAFRVGGHPCPRSSHWQLFEMSMKLAQPSVDSAACDVKLRKEMDVV